MCILWLVTAPECGEMRMENLEENQEAQKVNQAEVQREDRKAGSGGTTVSRFRTEKLDVGL